MGLDAFEMWEERGRRPVPEDAGEVRYRANGAYGPNTELPDVVRDVLNETGPSGNPRWPMLRAVWSGEAIEGMEDTSPSGFDFAIARLIVHPLCELLALDPECDAEGIGELIAPALVWRRAQNGDDLGHPGKFDGAIEKALRHEIERRAAGGTGGSGAAHEEAESAPPPNREAADSADSAQRDTTPTIQLTRLSDVETRPVRWLWPGKIPRGKIATLEGLPDLGKSTLTLDLAARVTRGDRMPDGSPGIEGNVLLIGGEDDAGDTIRPRFEAAGGDLDRCVIVDGIPNGEGGLRLIEIPKDLGAIERVIREQGAVLVVIDPLTQFLGEKVKVNEDHNVRRALGPLHQIAERTGATILLMRHLNKDYKNHDPMLRGGGSIGIIAAARAGLVVARHPDNEDQRVLAVTKCNIAPPSMKGSLAFELETAPNGVGRIAWRGPCDYAAGDLFRPPPTEQAGARADAEAFLREYLADGKKLSKDMETAAEKRGITMSTLKNARRALGIERGKGFDGHWRVWLPGTDGAQADHS